MVRDVAGSHAPRKERVLTASVKLFDRGTK